MTPVSLFQLLPKHILETICQFAMPLSEGLKARLCSVSLRTDLFYSLGPEWKEVALEHYFRHFTIALNCQSSEIDSTHPLGNIHVPVEKEYRSITAVMICVSLRGILSGDAAHTLAQSPYSSLVYSSARTMTIKLSGFYRCVTYLGDETFSYTPTFYQQLKKMFPNVTRVLISKSARETIDISYSNCKFEQCLLDLYTKYYNVYAALNLNGAWKSDFVRMGSVVTKMKLFFGDYPDETFQLIHACAFSLEALSVSNYWKSDICNIFMDVNGKPVEYTRLRHLKLSTVKRLRIDSDGTCAAVLLPSLTHLELEGDYAFEDDVIFKGASKTLKYASVIVDVHLATILKKYSVFKGPRYPSICHVKIGQACDGNDPTQHASHWAYISSIAHNLKALTIYPSSSLDLLVKSLSHGEEIQSIQHLTLDSKIFTFSSACSLIKNLPHMSQLMIACLYLDEGFLEMDKYELYDHVTREWNILSYHLRSFEVSVDFNKHDLAICVMLLSVVCPRLTRFRSSTRSIESVQEAISQAIRDEPFSRYTERLERLDFNGIPMGCETFSAKLTC